MKYVLTISYGELALKGDNRIAFENRLIKTVKGNLKKFDIFEIYKDYGKLFIVADEAQYPEMIEKLRKIFGIIYVTKCLRVDKDIKSISSGIIEYMKNIDVSLNATFKINAKRLDKKFEIKSIELNSLLGGEVLKNFSKLTVDVHNPDISVNIKVRDFVYIYDTNKRYKGYGGLPVGSSGSGLLLLSGGIDSPVAGFMTAKRGMKISALHFHSYPFTNERAFEKVKKLAEILTQYVGDITLYSINLLEIQKAIHEHCREREMTIISRRFMMKIAEKIADKNNINALITGESLGQVASQTIEGISVVNESVRLPILRPLVALDKTEIMDRAKEIGTYEISILPYEDCCTVFLPKRPVTKPRLSDILNSEKNLDENGLIEEAIKNMEIYHIDCKN